MTEGSNFELGYASICQKYQSSIVGASANQHIRHQHISSFETAADPDHTMDHFNDSITIQEVMESFGEVYIFDSNTPEFTNL